MLWNKNQLFLFLFFFLGAAGRYIVLLAVVLWSPGNKVHFSAFLLWPSGTSYNAGGDSDYLEKSKRPTLNPSRREMVLPMVLKLAAKKNIIVVVAVNAHHVPFSFFLFISLQYLFFFNLFFSLFSFCNAIDIIAKRRRMHFLRFGRWRVLSTNSFLAC